MNFQRFLLKQLFGVGVYKYFGELIFFLSSVIISRLLLPEEFGVIAMVTIFYSFLAQFTDMGVSESVIRERGDQQFYQNIQNLYLLIGLVAGSIMALLAYPIAVFFEQRALFPVGLTYAGVLFLYAFPKAMIAYLKKEGQLVLISKIELILVVFQVTSSILMAIAGFSYWSLVLPQVFNPLLYYFLYRRHVKIEFFNFSSSGLADVWEKVKSLVRVFGVLNFVQYWEKTIDNLWVGKLYGETGLGLYNRAYMLMNMPVNMVRGHINAVLYPVVINKSLTVQEIKFEMVRFIKLVIAVINIPAIIFILFPVKLSVLLWGENWYGVGEYLGILGIALLIQTFIQLSNSLYIILRKERVWFLNGVISGITTITLISIGIMYSISAMIYGYIIGILVIGLPITLYLGYYKSFLFTLRDIVNIVGANYMAAVILLALKLMSEDALLIYPAMFIAVISSIRVTRYVKHFCKEKK
ncbi:oligosaccharide flippase family protein [Fulvivirga sp. 29W222]|uniref:Oligosaccharide flippase family protein n=1 Tax=Fulvivirga marina TaxID=2494733 RepID=A0A937FWB4_9BACT|nr:oligosaccharide flippase family protein [Fulvivirga marina]MBL6447224.1 oligosaccharide flippase family protein [Fulvivirga marina]